MSKPKIDTSKWNRNRRLAVRAFVAWLRKRRAGETYDYLNSGDCPNARFHRSLGRRYSVPQAYGYTWFDTIEELAQAPMKYSGGMRAYSDLRAAARKWLKRTA